LGGLRSQQEKTNPAPQGSENPTNKLVSREGNGMPGKFTETKKTSCSSTGKVNRSTACPNVVGKKQPRFWQEKSCKKGDLCCENNCGGVKEKKGDSRGGPKEDEKRGNSVMGNGGLKALVQLAKSKLRGKNVISSDEKKKTSEKLQGGGKNFPMYGQKKGLKENEVDIRQEKNDPAKWIRIWGTRECRERTIQTFGVVRKRDRSHTKSLRSKTKGKWEREETL